MQIYTAKTYELQAVEEEQLCELLDRYRLQKASSVKRRKERERSIFAGLLLRYAFYQAGHGDVDWRQIEIGNGVYGKPYIKGYPEFQFGLSHSGEWVACAVDTRPVGIDIQEMKPWRMTLAKRFYHAEEYSRLLALEGTGQDRQTEAFYSMWTAKESAVKLSGIGIGAGIGRYVTSSDFNSIYDMERMRTLPARRYNVLKGYMLSVCSETGAFPDLPEIIDFRHCD